MLRKLLQLAGIGLVLVTASHAWGHSVRTQPQRDFYRAKQLNEIRNATRRYLDIKQAQADGYVQVTGNMPLQGIQFYHPGIRRFDFAHPAILLYVRQNGAWELVGLKYAVPGDHPPKEDPFPGVRWTRDEAACQYADWREFHARSPEECPARHPGTDSAYAAWHPDLWVIPLWLWYPNPNGLFASLNPLLSAFDDQSVPPGGASTWEEWRHRTEYSNFNHNLSGYLLLAIGGLMLLAVAGGSRFPWMTQLWPAVMVVLAIVVLYRSDPNAWPYGVKGFWESLAESKVLEHKISGLIVLVMGVVEWLRARQTLTHRAWGMLFPMLAISGGIVLFSHVHPESNFNYLGRLNLPHKTEGITAILIGIVWILNDWRIIKRREWRIAIPLLLIAMALQLILYVE